MSNELIHLPAILKKANRKADDSVTLSFETEGELTTEQFAFIDTFRKANGHLLFKKNAFKESDIPVVDTEGGKRLTPSQELRHSLYAQWVALREINDPKADEEFNPFYERAMRHFKQEVDSQHPNND